MNWTKSACSASQGRSTLFFSFLSLTLLNSSSFSQWRCELMVWLSVFVPTAKYPPLSVIKKHSTINSNDSSSTERGGIRKSDPKHFSFCHFTLWFAWKCQQSWLHKKRDHINSATTFTELFFYLLLIGLKFKKLEAACLHMRRIWCSMRDYNKSQQQASANICGILLNGFSSFAINSMARR